MENKNKQLSIDLNEKEIRLMTLTAQLETLEKGGGNWASPKASRRGRGLGLSDLNEFPPLDTSNSFEVLSEGESVVVEECESENGDNQGVNDRKKVSKPKIKPNLKNRKCTCNQKRYVRVSNKQYDKNLVLVADSQGRTCGSLLHEKLNAEKWGSEALVLPSATSEQVVEVASGKAKGLTNKDCLVILGGVNKVTNNSIPNLEHKLDKLSLDLSKLSSPPTVVLVETPLRYDTKDNSSISAQNRLFRNQCVKNKWSYLAINSMLSRDEYTKHGLHLNNVGKEIICNLVLNFIENFSGKSDQPKNTPVVQPNQVT